MSPYVLAFTADTVEIRMASNGSLIQTIAVPDLHLLSKKVRKEDSRLLDSLLRALSLSFLLSLSLSSLSLPPSPNTQGDLYFTSSSNMILSNVAKTPTPTRPSPIVPTKFPKNIDKKDFTSSTHLSEVSDLTYIYRITMQKMTGRSRSESVSSITNSQALNRSGSDELTNTCRASVSEIISEEDSLDNVHPILEDDDRPIMMVSFGSESPPDTGLRNEDAPDKMRWDSKSAPVFYENVKIGGFSDAMNPADCAAPRRRARAISGRSWNNCVPEYSPFPSSRSATNSNSHTKVHSPQSINSSSNGGADTASLLSSDSRLGQPPLIDLMCASPDSGVVHDDFNPLSSTPHGHTVAPSTASYRSAPSSPPQKTVQSHSILVGSTCTSHHSTPSSVSNVSDSVSGHTY